MIKGFDEWDFDQRVVDMYGTIQVLNADLIKTTRLGNEIICSIDHLWNMMAEDDRKFREDDLTEKVADKVIEKLKAVDTSEERRGEWVRCKAERMIIGYECSECGEVCRKTEYIPDCDFHTPSWKYCPNCGARMKD